MLKRRQGSQNAKFFQKKGEKLWFFKQEPIEMGLNRASVIIKQTQCSDVWGRGNLKCQHSHLVAKLSITNIFEDCILTKTFNSKMSNKYR